MMKHPDLILLLSTICLASTLASAARTGELGDFNAAPFGTRYVAKADEALEYAPQIADEKVNTAVDIPASGAAQIEWRNPRDIYAVNLVFDGDAPKADEFELQWYYHVWPDNGEGGWMKLDDPFNGRFVTAVVDIDDSKPSLLKLWIKPLEKSENPDIEAAGADWRTTYKIRAAFEVPVRLAEMECYTDSNWKSARLKIELLNQEWDGKVEARNARIILTRPKGRSAVVVDLRYADNGNRLSPDRGHVVVRRSGRGTDFSFFVDDVVRDGAIYVRDIDAFVCTEGGTQSYDTWAGPDAPWDATVLERVETMPEQSFETAMEVIPRKWVDDAHMGLPAMRQEISICARSQIYRYSMALRGLGSDRDRTPKFPKKWSKHNFLMITRKKPFAPPGPNRIERWLEEGYLPVVHSKWRDDDIDYHQTVFVTGLDPHITRTSLARPDPASKPVGEGIHAANFGSGNKGDEPTVLLSRLEITNSNETDQIADIWFKPSPGAPMDLTGDGLIVLDQPTKPSAGDKFSPVWGQIDMQGKGKIVCLKNHIAPGADPNNPRDYIRYTIKLAPGESHTIYVKVPYLEQLTQGEIAQLKALDWHASHDEIVPLWKTRLADAIAGYHVPEPMLVNLWRTNLWHVLIGTDRDPSTGLYEHGAGTYAYPMYANETMMVARSLEMRGEHEEARRLYEPYLLSQGTRGLPGNFKTKEGLLYAAAPPGYDDYTAQGYNMHHGFILWSSAEHYFWTRDKAYLEGVAPNLIAACDWITRERKGTMVLHPDGSRPVEYGLAPAGDLEDVEEYLYFYATNAHYYLGMKMTADALADIKHPQAARIAAEAEAYAEDIVDSVRESVATSPVVKLLDGTYIPYVPARAYALTDCKEGWIREALYCALHLVNANLIEPDDRLATWILQDLEDRIFFSPESGQPPEKEEMTLEEYWFTIGGYNPQPNLLDNSIAYLKRGQIPNFVRAFFNIFSASIYPDIICFSECVPPFASGGGPVYKTPDESKFIQYMRQMLVLEIGNELHVGRGVPRAWMKDGKYVELKNAATYFGPMDLKIASSAADGKITAAINLPTRNPAKTAHISLRHPEGKPIKSVTVNGEPWTGFDPATDTVALPGTMENVSVVAVY